MVAGEEDTCAPFFALNRLKGQLYDGTTRLFSDDSAQVPIATGMNMLDRLDLFMPHGCQWQIKVNRLIGIPY